MILHKAHRAAAFVLVVLCLAGCASRGNEVLRTQDPATVDLYVVDGKTTRDEVQGVYGAPLQSSFLNEKNEVWTYRWARASAQGQNFIPVVGLFVRGYDVRRKELVIVFDQRNVVVRHTMTDYNDTISTGLVNTGGAPRTNSVVSASAPRATTPPEFDEVAPRPSTPVPPTPAPSTPVPAAAPRAATVAPVASATPGPFDGQYRGGLQLSGRAYTGWTFGGNATLRDIDVTVTGGTGVGIVRYGQCTTPGDITLTISAAGAIAGTGNLVSGDNCTPLPVTFEGRVEGERLALTVRYDDRTADFSLTRSATAGAVRPTAGGAANLSAFDGPYRGGASLSGGANSGGAMGAGSSLRQVEVIVSSGNAIGLVRFAQCPQPGEIRLTIDTAGYVTGTANMLSGGTCGAMQATIEGRAEATRLLLTVSYENRSTEFTLTRQSAGARAL
jgi:hypothetical protein